MRAQPRPQLRSPPWRVTGPGGPLAPLPAFFLLLLMASLLSLRVVGRRAQAGKTAPPGHLGEVGAVPWGSWTRQYLRP